MNKKGIIAVIVIIILVILGFTMWGGNETSVNNPGGGDTEELPEVTKEELAPTTKDNTNKDLLSRLKSASVSATESGNRVALVNGTAKFTEGEVKGTITLGDIVVQKDIEGTIYDLAPISVSMGGSGTYKYIVLFEEKNGTISDKSYALIGDRVTITGIRADVVSGAQGDAQIVVTVSYLGHDQGEPLSSAPSVPMTKILIVKDGALSTLI
jgi:hypothetical protein